MNTKPRERFVDSITQRGSGNIDAGLGQGPRRPSAAKGMLITSCRPSLKEPRTGFEGAQAAGAESGGGVERNRQRSGEKIFVQRCTGCHGRKADGKGPNSLDILPRPRNLRNSAFVEQLADRRMIESILYGVQGTAMPAWIDYGLSQNDVGDIVNFIRSLNA